MLIGVPAETRANEARVAATPETVKKLVSQGHRVTVQRGAGVPASYIDDAFAVAGAELVDANTAFAADLVLKVHSPNEAELLLLKSGAVIAGMLDPFNAENNARLAASGITAFALEAAPRTTRAQSLDVLSSQANIAGYKAVLVASNIYQRFMPMLMTAAGTVKAARVLVLGAGVAGLQAIATAKRLGAVVEAYDVRAAAGQDVKSLGAKFLDVDLGGIETQDAGGYAKELSPEALQRGRDIVAKRAAISDVVITTAQVPGRKAPLMLTEDAVNTMRPGSVVVDLAASTGGNVAFTRPGEDVEHNGVIILGPLNLPATVPGHASQLYSRNLTSFMALINDKGNLKIDMNDDILKAACVTYQGGTVHPKVAAALGHPVA